MIRYLSYYFNYNFKVALSKYLFMLEVLCVDYVLVVIP
jgi:hypothetical protein